MTAISQNSLTDLRLRFDLLHDEQLAAHQRYEKACHRNGGDYEDSYELISGLLLTQENLVATMIALGDVQWICGRLREWGYIRADGDVGEANVNAWLRRAREGAYDT
jgi:hypothetical protein